MVSYFSSGAGFSKYFPIPSYQAKQVAAYVKEEGNTRAYFFLLNVDIHSLTHSTLLTEYYNKNGRAYPDVSAQGADHPIILNGKVQHWGGTSAAAPTFASGIALLNNLLRSKGKPTVGYIHPKIYANPKAFTDVTSGNAVCNGGSPGLSAKAGWDAVSGLGTPLFKNLRALYGV